MFLLTLISLCLSDKVETSKLNFLKRNTNYDKNLSWRIPLPKEEVEYWWTSLNLLHQLSRQGPFTLPSTGGIFDTSMICFSNYFSFFFQSHPSLTWTHEYHFFFCKRVFKGPPSGQTSLIIPPSLPTLRNCVHWQWGDWSNVARWNVFWGKMAGFWSGCGCPEKAGMVSNPDTKTQPWH